MPSRKLAEEKTHIRYRSGADADHRRMPERGFRTPKPWEAGPREAGGFRRILLSCNLTHCLSGVPKSIFRQHKCVLFCSEKRVGTCSSALNSKKNAPATHIIVPPERLSFPIIQEKLPRCQARAAPNAQQASRPASSGVRLHFRLSEAISAPSERQLSSQLRSQSPSPQS